jgi:two-component system chemotaxis sensor kinase CheA
MSDLDTYRALYVAESRENHETIVKNFLILERGLDKAAIDEIFRSAHSLKGMSASMGFGMMERVCHAMEDVFQQIRNGTLKITQTLVDHLLVASDDIEQMLDDIEGGGEGTIEGVIEHVATLKGHVGVTPPDGLNEPRAEVTLSTPPREESTSNLALAGEMSGPVYTVKVRLSAACDNKNIRGMIVLQNIEEIGRIIRVIPSRETVEDDNGFEGTFEVTLVSDAGEEAISGAASGTDVEEAAVSSCTVYPGAPSVQAEAAHEGRAAPDTRKERTEKTEKGREVKNIRVDITRLDQMMNLIEDLVINRGRITQIAKKYQIKELDETLSMVGRSVSDLQNLMMNIRMIPLSVIFNRFPRTVRDIALREGKEVEFNIVGGDTELDRSVMDGLNDPLLHLIRNAIDHGIERADDRERAGKPRCGNLCLSARRDRDNVIIEIADDGGGIRADRVIAKAIERGLVTPEAAASMEKEAVYDFLFQAGFSTADTITDLSGRGVGLDVVRTALQSLKGTIHVESTLGEGTRFELILPPTMAIVDVMMVRINSRRCAIPVANIVEVASLSDDRIHSVGSRETILMRDEVLLLDRLEDMFGSSVLSEILVVLQHQERKRSIAVDVIEGQQEVVIKPLGQIVGICRGISGVTIPGDGEVVPVLDVKSIVREN